MPAGAPCGLAKNSKESKFALTGAVCGPMQYEKEDKYGGPATKIEADLRYAKNNSVVLACGNQNSFYGFGSKDWDIRQSCQDSWDSAVGPCNSDYGSDLVLPLQALLVAADIMLDEPLGDRTERTGDDDMYQQCVERVTHFGVFGWVKDDEAWEHLKTLQSMHNDSNVTYPSSASLFFVGLVYDDIADLTYSEIMVLLRSFCASTTVREFGVKLLVSMTHDNMQGSRGGNFINAMGGPYFPSRIHTDIKVSAQLSMLQGPRSYLMDEILGTPYYSQDLEVLVGHYGEICKFDFSQLLVTLTSALGLLVVARTITDGIMTKALPLRKLYDQEKYHRTVDYSEVRDKLMSGDVALHKISTVDDIFREDTANRDPQTATGSVNKSGVAISKLQHDASLAKVMPNDQPTELPKTLPGLVSVEEQAMA
ncbi:hypothetical protein CYMTET_33633 [Cymbomonas tetramitiformis]|uniref:Uncharacterized protein n=1 Tax=Cymbomonas tetramitiformis TaxID=36881 RepID=A0AAE0FCN0_9CHLO|nr:hypothetical protein CYMTET_33633 [Cymbomonas tetramitiformis]